MHCLSARPTPTQRSVARINRAAANNQMHRMGSGDGRKRVILDLASEGDANNGVFEAAPPPGASNQWTPEVEGNWQNALDAAGQRHRGAM